MFNKRKLNSGIFKEDFQLMEEALKPTFFGKIDLDKILWNNQTPLMLAASLQKKNVCGFLIQKGASVDFRDEFGHTVLYIAAFHGRRDLCEFLIDNGAAINEPNKYGSSPLEMALVQNRTEIIDLFLARGINITDLEYDEVKQEYYD